MACQLFRRNRAEQLMKGCMLNHLVNGSSLQLQQIGSSKEFPQFTFGEYFLYNLFFFGFGEELGWNGFVLPRLQNKFNALISAIIFTIFWATWHWPLFLYRSGYTTMNIAGIFGWYFSLLTGRVFS